MLGMGMGTSSQLRGFYQLFSNVSLRPETETLEASGITNGMGL